MVQRASEKRFYNQRMRKMLGAIALMLGVLFLLSQFAELNKITEVLRRGNLIYLGLALLIEVAWIYNLGAFYQSIYHVLGMDIPRLHILKLVSAGYFLSVAAPSAGFSAMAVYLDDAKRHGRSTARVTVAGVLYIWFENIGTFGVALLGMAELGRRHDLHLPEITASLVLLAGALGIGLILYLGMHSVATLSKVLAFLSRAVNSVLRPFLRHDFLHESRAYEFSAELAEGIKALRNNPRWIARPMVFTVINKALLIALLTCCLLAFDVRGEPGTIVAGQGIAHMFLIVSPTPAGIGVVEGVLALALTSLGVPLSDSTVIALTYRAFSFWMPFFFGMVMLRSLSRMKIRPAAVQVKAGGD
jgi:uncharacterized protein (TIRG00374 family)